MPSRIHRWATHLLGACGLLGALLLAACGGGGSSGSVAPPPGTTFPLQSALSTLLASGYTKSASATGIATYQGTSYPITGSLSLSFAPLSTTAVVFEGLSAVSSTQAVSGSVSLLGQTLSVSSSQLVYFTPTLQPLGFTASGQYCVAAAPGTYPASVQVGDSGSIVHYDCWSDATKTSATGSVSVGYKVTTAYSTTTATVALTEVSFDTGGQVTTSETDNYIIDTGGALYLASGILSGTSSGVVLNLQYTTQ